MKNKTKTTEVHLHTLTPVQQNLGKVESEKIERKYTKLKVKLSK